MTNENTKTGTTSSNLSALDICQPRELMPYNVEAMENRLVYIRDVPAGVMLDFMLIDADGAERNEGLLKLIAGSVCGSDGVPLFDVDNTEPMKNMPMDVFTELATIVTETANSKVTADAEDEEGSTEAGKD